MPSPRLASLGWNPFFESHWTRTPRHGRDLVPARVVAEHRERYRLAAESGPLDARVSGRLRHAAGSRLDLPAVGDWVGASTPADGDAVIDVVLPRTSRFARQAAGRRVEPQLIAANVDVVAIVTAVVQDFNPRRLERYVEVVTEAGALPVVVLAKADLCPDVDAIAATASRSAPGVPLLVTSSRDGRGMDVLRSHVPAGVTLALVGSSGVGKSSLLNALLGASAQEVGEVRASDGRGRHVTTHRELFELPGCGLVLDTPGMRELAGWVDEPAVSGFEEVDALAAACRFADCRHEREPGCEVRRAVEDGRLDAGRLESHRKLERERAFQARRQDVHALLAERRRWKAIGKSLRNRPSKDQR